MKIKATKIFQKNWEAYFNNKYRIIVNEGGTGSSKTFSICQVLILICLKQVNKRILVMRKTLPALKATAMRDFFNILNEYNLYNPESHNKSENTYLFARRNNEVNFIGLDDAQKVRSRRQDIAWFNEANEFSEEEFNQIAMRTSEKIFMDYNPSDEYHWIYEKILNRDDAILITSNYKDNPFLSEEIIKEIERYKEVDEYYWKVYGLGLRASSKNKVFNNFEYVDNLPESYDEEIFGLDFGFNNPSALVQIREKDKEYYYKELIYKSGLTNSDLIKEMIEVDEKYNLNLKNKIIVADSAEPDRIKEIRDAGFIYITGAKKSEEKNKFALDYMKSNKMYIVKDSVNLLKEIKNYSYKVINGIVSDDTVKINNHLIDASIYAIYYLVNSRSKILYNKDIKESKEINPDIEIIKDSLYKRSGIKII